MGHIGRAVVTGALLRADVSLDAGTAGERPARVLRASGPRKHRGIGRRPPAPEFTIVGRSPLNEAATALWPWPVATYPGILKALSELFQGRARPYTIRDWRRGRRRTPQWALDLMTAELDQRIESLQHARALLAKEKGRP